MNTPQQLFLVALPIDAAPVTCSIGKPLQIWSLLSLIAPALGLGIAGSSRETPLSPRQGRHRSLSRIIGPKPYARSLVSPGGLTADPQLTPAPVQPTDSRIGSRYSFLIEALTSCLS
jgi:hypothetical protein